jgi:hypothetical protein
VIASADANDSRIADDVLYAAKERARRENKSAGQVISELARDALTGEGDSERPRRDAKIAVGFRPFARQGAIVTNDLIGRLREDDAY